MSSNSVDEILSTIEVDHGLESHWDQLNRNKNAKYACPDCSKRYFHGQSLARHRKNCQAGNVKTESTMIGGIDLTSLISSFSK